MTKLFTIALLIQCLSMSLLIASDGNAQVKSIEEVQVFLSLKNAKVERAFKELEKNTDYNFVFANREIRNLPNINLESKEKTVYDILMDIALQTDLRFKQVNNNIHVKKNSGLRNNPEVNIFYPETIIRGKVQDENGNPIPGAVVLIKGTTKGTVTDVDGNYNIEVDDPNAVLVYSFIGYVRKEVSIGNQAVIDVVLDPDFRSLEEVIVIGFGEKSRKLMTESIGTVGSKEINQLPVASVDQALQGRISGVQVTSVDGTPGSPVSIRIRGVGTVGNTQPLFVIDGVPVGNNSNETINPLATINPADIESVSVLKDASAAAVYGVRAANGVILITTKRGKTGKPTVSVESYYGVQQIPRFNEYNPMDAYLSLTQNAYDNFNAQNNLSPGDPSYQLLHPDLQQGSPIRNRNNTLAWRDAALNLNAPIQNHNASVSGGGEGYNYFVSGGYFSQQATVRRWDLDRYTFRANSDFKVNNRVRVGQTFTVSHQHIERGMNGGGDGFLLQNSMTMPPFFNIFEDPNNPIPGNRYGYDGNADLGGLTIGNQVGINEIVDNHNMTTRMLGSIYGEVDIIEGLTFRSVASVDLINSRNTSWRPEYLVAEMGLNRPGNIFGDSRSENVTQVFTNTLNYNKSFGNHNIDVLGGLEYQQFRGTTLGVEGFDFLSTNRDFYSVVNNGRGDPFVGGGASQSAFVGYIGRASYNYLDKYLLTATVRRDGTSNFSPEGNRRWGTFPSFSGAWRISEESFFNRGKVNDLKLRASWGQLGNANTQPFPHIFRVSTTPDYALGGSNTVQAPAPINFVNQDVIWETVETFDIGFDMSMFNNKLDILATYYDRTTKDFLFNLPLSFISGFTGTPVNLGTVSNKGVEVEIGYNMTFANGLQMRVSGNVTTVRNRLEELAPGLEEFTASDIYRTAIGRPIGYFFGYMTDGLYQTQGEIDAIFTGGFRDASSPQGPRPGDVKFLDVNGPGEGAQFSGEPDGLIDFNDRAYLGKTIPSFFYGLSLDFNFRNFDMSMLWQGVGDVQIYNEVRRNGLNLGGVGRNMLVETQERWTGPGTSNSIPRAISSDPNQNNRFSDRFVENAGFVRLRNIQIGYTLPRSLIDRWSGFNNGRVYIGGSNLLTFTNYSGMDPEVMTYRSNASQVGAGTDRGNMPQPRIYQMGVQLSF